MFTILLLCLLLGLCFDWEDISNTPDSVSSAIQTSRILSEILRCASYFQLSSWCLDIPMKHCFSCLMYYLKGGNYSPLLRLAADCSKIARTSVKVGKTTLLPLVLFRAQERISEQAFNWSLVGWAMIRIIVEVRFVEMTGDCYKQTSATVLHVSVVWAFLQKWSFWS